jgi:hypothetical protein
VVQLSAALEARLFHSRLESDYARTSKRVLLIRLEMTHSKP